jgi:hypothetical protein
MTIIGYVMFEATSLERRLLQDSTYVTFFILSIALTFSMVNSTYNTIYRLFNNKLRFRIKIQTNVGKHPARMRSNGNPLRGLLIRQFRA